LATEEDKYNYVEELVKTDKLFTLIKPDMLQYIPPQAKNILM